MSAEEGEAGPACTEARRGEPQGGATTTHHTWEEGEPHGSQGHPHPGDEEEDDDEEEAKEEGEEAVGEEGKEEEGGGEDRGREHVDACGGRARKFNVENNGGDFSSEEGVVGGRCCKAQAMHSNCSSETCIPTPSCRICFQGAEQVNSPAVSKVPYSCCSVLVSKSHLAQDQNNVPHDLLQINPVLSKVEVSQ